MVEAQRHRGPESEGFFVDEDAKAQQVALGHNRLSIIDVSPAASQPMRSADGRYVMVYNGAVHNWREIAAELPSIDLTSPSGRGDTAVIFAALRRWGPEAVTRFNGMWALVLYDAHKKTLLLSRDRLGIKPLYWHQDAGSLLIASEAKAILRASQTRFPIDRSVAVTFLARGLVDTDETSIFAGIRLFPPASTAILDLAGQGSMHLEPKRYWHHPVERGHSPTAGTVSRSEIRETFTSAVASSLRSDVPVGVLLSGGIDSSAIAGAAAQLGVCLPAFTMVWKPLESSECRYAEAVARHNDLPLHKIDISDDPLDLLDRLPEATWLNDGPIAGIEEVARIRIMECARAAGVQMMLCGQGADEQLAGYRKFYFFWLRELLASGRVSHALRLLLRNGATSAVLREFELMEALRYLAPRWLTRHSFIAAEAQALDRVELGMRSSFAEREWEDLSRLSLPTVLHSEDRMSMARSVELRVPFLDNRLVSMFARLHPDEKFHQGWTKGIFRESVAHMLPPEVQFRRDKTEFKLPLDEWIRGPYRRRLTAVFTGPMLAVDQGLIDPVLLRRVWRDYLDARGALNGRYILRAYALEVFLREFSEHIADRPSAGFARTHSSSGDATLIPEPLVKVV